MTQQFKDYFSTNPDAYRSYRPGYPPGLFAWLAGLPARRDAALDCGCGTGQASVALAEHFARVYAVDPSAGQIESATPHDRVEYHTAPAEATGLPDSSVDLVIAAQALHWFDFDRFYPEVRRVAREEAVFAAFTYGLLAINEELDRIIGHFYRDIIGPCWPPERAHVDSGYQNLPFPFAEMEAPAFAMEAEWDLVHLMGYFETWSAVKEYRRITGGDPLELVAEELAGAWGAPAAVRRVSWPLLLRVGRIA